MTLLPKVKLKTLVSFPANVRDGTGIDVTRSNGSYQFDLAFSDFAPAATSLPDPAHQNALLWNENTNSYSLAPVPLLGAGGGIADAPNDGTQYGRQSFGWTPITSSAFTQAGVGAVVRTPQDKMRDIVSVKDFGAVGDGVTNDSAAINKAVVYVLSRTCGGRVYLPAGTYKLTTPILIDYTSLTGRLDHLVRIEGDGSGQTRLVCGGIPGTSGINFVGNVANLESHFELFGLRLAGDLTASSVGINVSVGAYCHFEDLIVEGFALGANFTDFEQSLFVSCHFMWNTDGLVFNGKVSTTDPNSNTFINCTIASNKRGMTYEHANAVVFINGSVQYNGAMASGSVLDYGLKFVEPGSGYGTILFYGTIFEGNGGIADLWIHNTLNPASIGFFGASFVRTNNVIFDDYNIYLTGSAALLVSITGASNFRHFNTYVPNAARPYINKANASAKIVVDPSTLFFSATETPAASLLRRIASYLVASAVYDPPSIANAASAFPPAIIVAGAALGDTVLASFSVSLAGLQVSAYVSAVDQVQAVFSNLSGGAVDLASGTLTVTVFKT